MTQPKRASSIPVIAPNHPYWLRRGVIAIAFLPFSLLFGAISFVRKWWFTQFRRPWKANIPIVIVGNLIAGGAGKTPTAIALIEHLLKSGHRPALVSRGYGRERQIACVEVTSISSPEDVGDEPLLIKRRTNIPIFVAAKRIKAVVNVMEKYPDTTVIVSDDGLQHYSLARDIELVVFDERGIGNGWLIPAGPLREPLCRAKTADFIIYNAPTAPLELPGYMAKRKLGGYMPLSVWLKDEKNNEGAGSNEHFPTPHQWIPMEELLTRQKTDHLALTAVAGIARPERFFNMLNDMGLVLDQTLPLPDHYDYPDGSFDTINADIILMTEKDAAKCAPFKNDARLYVVTLSYSLEDSFFNEFDTLLNKHQTQSKK